MKENTRNCLVGMFVLLALGAGGVLMVWLGETPSWLRTGEWTLQIRGVREVRGISEGSSVHLSGVEIGRVTGLGFEDPERPEDGVLIAARIKRGYSVPGLSTARIYGATLGIGAGQINIVVPPTEQAPLPKDGSAIISGEMASPFGNIMPEGFLDSVHRAVDQIANLAEAIKPVADNFAVLIEPRSVLDVSQPGAKEQGITANLSTAIERIDTVAANLNTVLGDERTQENILSIVSDLREASIQLKTWVEMVSRETRRTSDNVNESVNQTRGKIEELLVVLVNVAERLDTTAGNLAAVTGAMAKGEGTAGRLVYDPRLYEAAVLSTERLSELLSSLNRITGKIEHDGHITIAQETAVGTFKKDFPVGKSKQAPRP